MKPENNNIHTLKRIQKVSAPPFLFTRIEAKLEQHPSLVSKNWLWASSFGLLLLLCINGYFINQNFSSDYPNTESSQTIIEGMSIDFSNQLYHE